MLMATQTLTGHECGTLFVSWCYQDAGLLFFSCGKNNRTLCWIPEHQRSSARYFHTIYSQLTLLMPLQFPTAENWVFQISWCPRAPELPVTNYIDDTMGTHVLQSTNDCGVSHADPNSKAWWLGCIRRPGFSRTMQPAPSLVQPPKWLRSPVSISIACGG